MLLVCLFYQRLQFVCYCNYVRFKKIELLKFNCIEICDIYMSFLLKNVFVLCLICYNLDIWSMIDEFFNDIDKFGRLVKCFIFLQVDEYLCFNVIFFIQFY